MLAFVLTLSLNHSSCSVSSQEAMDSDLMGFLEKPRASTQAAIEVINTKYSLPGGLAVFTARHSAEDDPIYTNSSLLFVNNQGKIVKELFAEGFRGYSDPHMFNETILMVSMTPNGFLSFLNLETNKQYTITAINGDQIGHHDIFYNPLTDTFLTLVQKGVEAEGTIWLVDMVYEFNWKGELLWKWDMSEWVSSYKATQCVVSDHSRHFSALTQFGDSYVRLPVGTKDYSHSNTVYWDTSTNIIYINPRNLDNVWAIEYPTGKVLWRAGRNGNFTMYDKHGVQKESLWWHSHSFYPVPGEPNKFILFDNDLHNGTAEPNIPSGIFEGPYLHTSTISRLVEVEINTETWTMNETWSWEADPKYYSPIWGYSERLPNGNRIGCFGSRSYRTGKIVPPYPEGGATLIEVNDTDIVWQLTFPAKWWIYRGRRFQPSLTLNSHEELICDQDENDCQAIVWTGKSVFKDYYQITKDGELLVNNTWATAKIYYDLPSDLEIGTHEYTLTVFDLAGQSVSNTVKVTVKNDMNTPTTPPPTNTTIPVPILYHGHDPGIITVFEFLTIPVSVSGLLVGGLTTVVLILLLKRKNRFNALS